MSQRALTIIHQSLWKVKAFKQKAAATELNTLFSGDGHFCCSSVQGEKKQTSKKETIRDLEIKLCPQHLKKWQSRDHTQGNPQAITGRPCLPEVAQADSFLFSFITILINAAPVSPVGRCGAHSRLLQVPQGGRDVVAPVGGQALPDAAGWELQPRHPGGRRRLSAEPVGRQLEGNRPVTSWPWLSCHPKSKGLLLV